jgi:hypothetical protein
LLKSLNVYSSDDRPIVQTSDSVSTIGYPNPKVSSKRNLIFPLWNE